MTEYQVSEQIPGWYAEVGEGWKGILVRTHVRLLELDHNYTVAQVKEKFGGLRIYLNDIKLGKSHKAYTIIDMAEKESTITCEWCGDFGSLKKNASGWYRTLCEGECSIGYVTSYL